LVVEYLIQDWRSTTDLSLRKISNSPNSATGQHIHFMYARRLYFAPGHDTIWHNRCWIDLYDRRVRLIPQGMVGSRTINGKEPESRLGGIDEKIMLEVYVLDCSQIHNVKYSLYCYLCWE